MVLRTTAKSRFAITPGCTEKVERCFMGNFWLKVKVWTKSGADTPTDVYWGRSQAVCNNDPGDVASLADASGTVVAQQLVAAT